MKMSGNLPINAAFLALMSRDMTIKAVLKTAFFIIGNTRC